MFYLIPEVIQVETNNESFELDNVIRKDHVVSYLKSKVNRAKWERIIFSGVIIILVFVIMFFASQFKAQKIQSKKNSMKLYNIGRKIEEKNRRDKAIAMVSDVALECNSNLDEDELGKVAELLYDVGELRYKIPVEHWLVLITTESFWKPNDVSHKGAVGFMQVMPPTGEMVAEILDIPYHGSKTLKDYTSNVRLGMYYLYKLKSYYVEPEYYFSAYFWGPTTIGSFYHTDEDGKLIKEKLAGKYRKYFYNDICVRGKRVVEKLIDRKILIQ